MENQHVPQVNQPPPRSHLEVRRLHRHMQRGGELTGLGVEAEAGGLAFVEVVIVNG